MSQSDENQPAAPVAPKALTPYRHKLAQSAFAIAMAMRGKPNMSQDKQIRILQAVNAELRKMAAGAQKALDIAQNRDYEAYLKAKQDLKEGKLSEAEQAEFDQLVAGLTDGTGEYQFTEEDVDPDDEAAMAKLESTTEENQED